MASNLFAALLKYWRGRRGLSQLDLALEAGVSARHVSFLESGRAQPSEAMVRRLFGALGVSPRDRDEALRAAGIELPEPIAAPFDASIEAAITHVLAAQEPYPAFVATPETKVLRHNRAAALLFADFVAEPTKLVPPFDMFSLVFDPALQRPFITNWESVARQMLGRIQREALHRRGDALHAVVERALAYPGVPAAWRTPDFSAAVEPTFTIRLARGDVRLAFLTTITTFSAPQSAALEELRIESCFPLDEPTRRHCAARFGAAPDVLHRGPP